MSRDWMATYRKPKGFVTPLELAPDDIDIQDIQHALSNICRFNGHCREFYSVAQHSVHVSELLARNGYGVPCQLVGLLHDASEAYLGDIIRPLKKTGHFESYLDIELDISRKVMNKFLPPAWNWLSFSGPVEWADNDLLTSEAIQLFNIQPKDWGKESPDDYFLIKPVNPTDAKLLFEDRFHELVSVLET